MGAILGLPVGSPLELAERGVLGTPLQMMHGARCRFVLARWRGGEGEVG